MGIIVRQDYEHVAGLKFQFSAVSVNCSVCLYITDILRHKQSAPDRLSSVLDVNLVAVFLNNNNTA